VASNDPNERKLIASRAALLRWSRESGVEAAQRAQAGLLRKFYNQTDPSLIESERWRRAERLRKAHMIELSRKAARARRAC
jgi:hypothetical protein